MHLLHYTDISVSCMPLPKHRNDQLRAGCSAIAARTQNSVHLCLFEGDFVRYRVLSGELSNFGSAVFSPVDPLNRAHEILGMSGPM